MLDLQSVETYREGNRFEAKAAQGGLPKSTWETYSAFANSDGGVIVLGLKELADRRLVPVGLADPERREKEFWDALNGGKIVSSNILTSNDVRIETIDDVRVLVISVPRAQRADKPVHVKDNPFTGSFRRNGEGDYRCSRDEVKAMIRDSLAESADRRPLEHAGIEALCHNSVSAYRNNLRTMRPQHPWNDLPDEDFLVRVEALSRSSHDGALHPTRAGLLMFGWEYEITAEFPFYFLDYREVLSEKRWDDRIVSNDGEWSGNVFDFWRKVSIKLTADLPRPFQLEGLYRVDDTPMHKALREALANMLLHADYYGNVSSVVTRYDNQVVFSNAGTPLVATDVAMAGGTSMTRNPSLMKMFNLIDIGERAGSGFDTMRKGAAWAGARDPQLTESFAPDKTSLVVWLPEKDPALRAASSWKKSERVSTAERITPVDNDNADKKDALDASEANIMELVDSRERISRSDVQKTFDVSKSTAVNLLGALVKKGLLKREGSGPAVRYARA